MSAGDPYSLLGVPRDATQERIRHAYELAINRAHRDGAHRNAVELSRAYDTLSSPQRRALYERHGLMSVRERSPGAAPPPTPWREVKKQSLPPYPGRRGRTKLLPVFCLGLVGGVIFTAGYFMQEAGPVPASTVPAVDRQHQVLCDTTPAGEGYIYSEINTNVPACRNGAAPRVLRP